MKLDVPLPQPVVSSHVKSHIDPAGLNSQINTEFLKLSSSSSTHNSHKSILWKHFTVVVSSTAAFAENEK